MSRNGSSWGLTLLSSLLLSILLQAQAVALTLTATASPTTVQAGQTEQLTTVATAVYNHPRWTITSTVTHNGVTLARQTHSGLTFTGGNPLTEDWQWQLPRTAQAGTYTFTTEVLDENKVFVSSAAAAFTVPAALVNGLCGSANGAVTNVPPNANLCNAGTASAVTGNGPWFWSCAGSGGGTTASCSTAVASCPQGQTYVSAGDGCVNAQATGSLQRANYFTGFIQGVTYATRPPWNVAGVDYAVGYSGTLKDPAISGNLPACVSSYNANMLIANADMQPCVLDHLDFTLHGGYCFMVTGTGGNTVTFSNDHFATGSSNCTQYSGWIQIQAGITANVLVKYSEFDDNYGCTCGGAISTSGAGDITVEYSGAVGVTGRFENTSSSASGSIHNKYNYIEGIGSTYEHGEVVELNTDSPYVYSELWNNYYASSTNCCNTALIYMTAGLYNNPGNITNGTASYNVLIARTNPSLPNGGVSASAPVWVQATGGTIITNLTVSNNYIDSTGSFWPITSYPSDGTGAITNATCSGNISLVTATLTDGVAVTAGRALTGTFSSGAVTLICK